MEGKIIHIEPSGYGRSGIITLRGNRLIADNSDEEYGEIEIDLDILLEEIRKYKEERDK